MFVPCVCVTGQLTNLEPYTASEDHVLRVHRSKQQTDGNEGDRNVERTSRG
jgi:hypothetical protein